MGTRNQGDGAYIFQDLDRTKHSSKQLIDKAVRWTESDDINTENEGKAKTRNSCSVL
jgi:hypothetical protein